MTSLKTRIQGSTLLFLARCQSYSNETGGAICPVKNTCCRMKASDGGSGCIPSDLEATFATCGSDGRRTGCPFKILFDQARWLCWISDLLSTPWSFSSISKMIDNGNRARPPTKWRLVLVLLLILPNHTSGEDIREDETCANAYCKDTKNYTPSNLDECGVWLAPSSIPGAGLGMYAGRDFKKGEYLQLSGDVVIPQIDCNQHQFQLGDDYFLLWDDYTWDSGGLGMDTLGYRDVKVQSPGFGSAANCFIDLINTDELSPNYTIPNGLHRSKDPGVGAFSYFHNRQSTATVPIGRGEEFFVDYGEQWFRDRPHFASIPLLGDLDRATGLHRAHLELRQKHPKVHSDIFDEMWITFVENTEFHDSRVIGAFRRTQEEWEQLWHGKTLKEIRIEEGRRTDEWLREHGVCADNIREGESTIPQAGRGGFASRRLVKDSVIAPMPLIHIADKKILEMYGFEDIGQLKLAEPQQVIGIQLTVNYCFGHQESTLLLCPYGPLTSLINHNRTQANVKVQWPTTPKGNHDPGLLERLVEHFGRDRTAKLAMELVATRDIMPGEELFLDYGSAWEAAWLEHVRTWKPPKGAESYVSAFELNSSLDRLRTVFEQLEDPYPDNVILQCNQAFLKTIDFDLYRRKQEVRVVDHHGSRWYPCEVLRFQQGRGGRFLYTAVAMVAEGQNDKVSLVPREAFRFVDRPYTSDLLLRNAFRHAMMVPDEMFPEYWMNA